MYFQDTNVLCTNLKARRHSEGSLGIHPYFGKIDPALANALIEKLSSPGQLVLDPFCGSGTVLHEAICLGRDATGWDTSDVALLIAAGKCVGFTAAEAHELNSLYEFFAGYVKQDNLLQKIIPDAINIPAMPRVREPSTWFTINALKELAFIRNELKERQFQYREAELLAELAFSRIITAASNQQGESTYRRVAKPNFQGRVIQLYCKSLRATMSSANKFSQLVSESGLIEQKRLKQIDNVTEINLPGSVVTLKKHDARMHDAISQQSESVDLVVTSPPYLMSWDYGLYHKFRFYWLGYNLDSYEETEIGRHLRRQNDDVMRYKADMANAFKSLQKVVKKSGYVAMVNAPSVVHGSLVDTNELLVECAAGSGFDHIGTEISLHIPGPHHGMYSSLTARGTKTAGVSGKREHVVLLRKR
ncbi:DNA methyltransferase [Methylobacterium sp. Leaf125]|uniref:DNA methyltransferase n=1 Tax=Methylobacterium sp. Leaf125 TaxID=1736265 RepID=UPI0009EBEF41|nr:DNA methyltransferase [Methylobacterium sp. Leaf125]